MQPETETLPNGKKIIVNDEGQKPKVKEVSDMTPSDQWDQLAFKLIQQELVPKGYSEIKRGPYRGTVQSNIPFLPKKTVQRCQNLAAQCVRSYRERVRRRISDHVKELDQWVKEDEQRLKACRFWEFRKSADLKYKIRSLYGQAGSARTVLTALDQTGIK